MQVCDQQCRLLSDISCSVTLLTLLQCSNTFLEMPVVVHEFVTYAVSEEEMLPQPLNKRAKLFRALMPPDQLNPNGWINGAIDAFMPIQVRCSGHAAPLMVVCCCHRHSSSRPHEPYTLPSLLSATPAHT